MPYYGEGLPYYYGGAFSNHSSLMTGAPRPFHTPLSRYSPHLSTISESPLSTLRRYSPVAVPTRPRRVIDTADIDVSTPRILSQDGNHQRNRLRRDRPTIKIRSQALKDNPALRQHNERHEKSVGELLVEKFLIKDKKLEEEEKRLQLFHQASLLQDEEDDVDLQQIKKITRRFTRRRSSADIQLDPEQIEREVAYAQVQAKVLDTLVAEEQAEIQDAVRRGTLIKKGTVGGPRTVPGFFRSVDGDTASQGEEEAAAQKMRKNLKKLKKKKKTTDKPSPPEDGNSSRERRSSTSSEASVDVQTSENSEEKERKRSKPQTFKVEASNSVGDFSTIWVNSGAIEQFRESVKIPVPRKITARKTDRHETEEESETEVILPVKRPYIKDTSRNSVYFTVKTPPETLKSDPLKDLDTITNGMKSEKEQESSKEKETDQTSFVEVKKSKEANLKSPLKDKVIPKIKKEEIPDISKLKKEESIGVKEPVKAPTTKRVEESNVTASVEESSASVALPSVLDRLPKASKINTDENNAVEAPKCLLRGPEYLAKPMKAERDEDVASLLPGKKISKTVTLRNASAAGVYVEPASVELSDESKKENQLVKTSSSSNDATAKLVTLLEDFKSDTQKAEGSESVEKLLVEDGKDKQVKSDVKMSKLPFMVAVKKNETNKVENKALLKSTAKTENKEARIPWRNKFAKVNSPVENNIPLDRSISMDSQPVLPKEQENLKSLKQSTSVDDTLVNKMQVEKPVINGDSGALSKSTSTESIDFWSEIKGPESPKVAKVVNKGFSFTGSKSSEPGQAVEDLGGGQLDKKKETDPKISVATPPAGLSNIPVIEEEQKTEVEPEKLKTEQRVSTSEVSSPSIDKSEVNKDDSTLKKGLKKKRNLSLAIGRESTEIYSTVKKAPLKREDSSASTVSAQSVTSTPDTSVPASEVSTPVSDISVPIINIVEAPTPTRSDSQVFEEDDEPKTPTNEWPDIGLPKISKWNNHSDLSNADEVDKDITPVPSKEASVTCSPEGSPESSKKKKVIRKKKTSTTKKSSTKKEAKKDSKESKKNSSKTLETLKPPEAKNSSKSSPKNTPTQRPVDLIRMFYTTPSALLTATPRDLSKVRRAKIKRKKHHSRNASMSSDSTGSTTSTATTESSGSTCTELDDDPEHKRMNSTRSNDSGFDGSPRISNCDMACHKKCEKLTGNLCGLNQKLVAEALQALRRAPSQSSDTQRNSDSSDHFPSGRITPPATNLPRFKKYSVSDFNFLKVLGKGSFGKVLLSELRGTECVYAVKCLKKDVVLEDDDVECTLIERKVLTLATRHPYLCHLFCTFQTDSHLFFVMEYLNGGDLMFHIQKSGRFPEPRARFYAAEIWSGLNFLHKKGIVYRDLKLDNVLLDFEGHIRIADFGMCKLQIFLDRTADTFCGTPDYMAPEIIKGLKYNQAVDWWSYGVLLYEMLTGQSPFSGCDEDELFWSICNERPFIPRYLSQDSSDILIALLEKDSGKRLPGHEIAYHSFFQSLPWDRLERRQLEPPFKPALDHTLDTRYFDTAFTAERPRLTPVPEQILSSMDQGVFRGFSYTNPNATD
ncbi:PREDICTED: titin homolog isoform X2 [Habropoda laboriosa]|uniref:titin homolog isoform X2 n=1 Tax=Habropoda laboriosa TaxID=597456 RepID=UPI00083D402C|nr:PREDICTED: titin homolog isoform X2 [Habropoda laboriosa]